MAVAEASSCGDALIRLNCSHGGRFLPLGPDGALRYVGGETRVLAVPRAGTTFRDLAARLSREVAGGGEVRAIRHRLADEDPEHVVVSCRSTATRSFFHAAGGGSGFSSPPRKIGGGRAPIPVPEDAARAAERAGTAAPATLS